MVQRVERSRFLRLAPLPIQLEKKAPPGKSAKRRLVQTIQLLATATQSQGHPRDRQQGHGARLGHNTVLKRYCASILLHPVNTLRVRIKCRSLTRRFANESCGNLIVNRKPSDCVSRGSEGSDNRVNRSQRK